MEELLLIPYKYTMWERHGDKFNFVKERSASEVREVVAQFVGDDSHGLAGVYNDFSRVCHARLERIAALQTTSDTVSLVSVHKRYYRSAMGCLLLPMVLADFFFGTLLMPSLTGQEHPRITDPEGVMAYWSKIAP